MGSNHGYIITTTGEEHPDTDMRTQGVWFGEPGSSKYRKWLMIDDISAANNGVYVHTGGAERLVLMTTNLDANNTMRVWGEITTDNQKPAATVENHQIGSTLSADGLYNVSPVPEWLKVEMATADNSASCVAVLMAWAPHAR